MLNRITKSTRVPFAVLRVNYKKSIIVVIKVGTKNPFSTLIFAATDSYAILSKYGIIY